MYYGHYKTYTKIEMKKGWDEDEANPILKIFYYLRLQIYFFCTTVECCAQSLGCVHPALGTIDLKHLHSWPRKETNSQCGRTKRWCSLVWNKCFYDCRVHCPVSNTLFSFPPFSVFKFFTRLSASWGQIP